jgi:hypothetical protein
MPTHREADAALGTKACGARLAHGPWQQLPKGRWAVPAVAYMSFATMGANAIVGEVVLAYGTVTRNKRQVPGWVAIERTSGTGRDVEVMR